MSAHVAVVGAGVSGLSAAYRLRRELGSRARITVCEAGDDIGGKIRTRVLAGAPFDVGAEAFLARRPEALELAGEVGLTDELTHPTTARSRLRAGGQLCALPARTMMGIPTEPDAAAELLSEYGRRAAAGEHELPAVRLPEHDRALGGLLRERFGDELVDRLVDPLLGGVYAGGSDGLGLRATMPALAAALDAGAGSVTAAARGLVPEQTSSAPVFGTLRHGLGELNRRLAERGAAEVRTSTTVRGLCRSDTRTWRLLLGAAAPEHAPDDAELDVDAVILAVPAPAAARLLAEPCPDAAEAFGEVELASMGVVSLALPAGTVLPEASGTLIGARERRADGSPFAAKAFTFSANKWAHHDTGAAVPVRASVGRFGDPGALRGTDEELIRQVRADLAELTGCVAEPVDAHVTRWGGGLPQYGVGHTDRVARVERAIARVPALEVAGASLHGVGIPACIATADGAARGIAGVLTAR